MLTVFKEFRIYPDFINGHFIEWDLNNAFNGKYPYTFTLEISETEDFSSPIFTKELGDTYYTIDDSNLKQGATNNYFYRVKLVTGDKLVFYSGGMGFDSYKDGARKYKMASNIMRIELISQRFAGNDAFLLKRKGYGADADTNTVDPITGMIIANSKNFATAKSGGYYDPIKISIRALSNDEAVELDEGGMGTKDTVGGTFRMIGFPAVTEYDIIVLMPINHRYNIRKVSNAYFPGSSIRVSQQMVLSQIPFTDPIYQIPIPIDKQL